MTWDRLRAVRLSLLITAVTISLGACRSVQTPSTDDPRQSLQRTADFYARSFATKNADSVIAFFDSTVVVVSPQGRAPVEGIAANRAGWERLFRAGNPFHSLTIERVDVAASEDLGYVTGHWAVGMDTPGGRAEARGYYLSVWRRRGAAWRQVAVSAYTLP